MGGLLMKARGDDEPRLLAQRLPTGVQQDQAQRFLFELLQGNFAVHLKDIEQILVLAPQRVYLRLTDSFLADQKGNVSVPNAVAPLTEMFLEGRLLERFGSLFRFQHGSYAIDAFEGAVKLAAQEHFLWL